MQTHDVSCLPENVHVVQQIKNVDCKVKGYYNYCICQNHQNQTAVNVLRLSKFKNALFLNSVLLQFHSLLHNQRNKINKRERNAFCAVGC